MVPSLTFNLSPGNIFFYTMCNFVDYSFISQKHENKITVYHIHQSGTIFTKSKMLSFETQNLALWCTINYIYLIFYFRTFLEII